jgi:hypothetical protein
MLQAYIAANEALEISEEHDDFKIKPKHSFKVILLARSGRHLMGNHWKLSL